MKVGDTTKKNEKQQFLTRLSIEITQRASQQNTDGQATSLKSDLIGLERCPGHLLCVYVFLNCGKVHIT